jgi:hypothetical protein
LVDLETIRPGDHVAAIVHEKSVCYADCDGHQFTIQNGEVFVVADPPTDNRRRHARLIDDRSPRGYFLSAPHHLNRMEPAE